MTTRLFFSQLVGTGTSDEFLQLARLATIGFAVCTHKASRRGHNDICNRWFGRDRA